MARIFLTGAAGFIGFHVAQRALERGDEVLGIDNFNNFYSPELKRARQKQLPMQIVQGDLCDRNLLRRLCDEFRPTHVLHLAAQAGVRNSLTEPRLYLRSNIDGFLEILELCREIDRPLIYASSSSVYGMSAAREHRLSAPANTQASLYGATKKCNEMMAHVYNHCFDLPVTGLRFFTVYGPWGRPDMAYFKFAKAMVRGEPIQLYNSGCVERDFTYIDDIVEGTLAALDRASPLALYNLGNCRAHPVGTLVDLLEKHLGLEADRQFVPMQMGDVVSTCADISLSQKELGYQPKVSLDEGLGKFCSWFNNQLSLSQ